MYVHIVNNEQIVRKRLRKKDGLPQKAGELPGLAEHDTIKEKGRKQ